jgi:hypothetical protein
MLLAEPRLDTLIEQLRRLPGADRRAILALLSPHERERVRARLRGAVGAAARPVTPFSADIAARIAAGADAPITGACRAALADALVAMGQGPSNERSGSLIEAVGGFLRAGRPG